MKIYYLVPLMCILLGCSPKHEVAPTNMGFEAYLVDKINEVNYVRNKPKLEAKSNNDGVSREDIFYNQTREGSL